MKVKRSCKLQPGTALRRPGVLAAWAIFPIRLVVAVSLLANAIYTISHFQLLRFSQILLLGLHLIVAMAMLNECRRSQRHHKALEDICPLAPTTRKVDRSPCRNRSPYL